jgi:ATP phosphoribosyltransferase regulatory subunit HisZ
MNPMNKKPNFQTMNEQELKSYILSHREDNEAFYAYVDKVHQRKKSSVYPPLTTLEDMEKYPEVIEQMRRDSGNKFNKNDFS